MKTGGCVSQSSKFAKGLRGRIRDNECYRRRLLPRARYWHSSTSLAAKRKNGRGKSSLGPVEENFIGPSMLEISFQAHTERAQSGMRIRGLQAGPKASQAHQIAALRLLLPSELCPGDERVGVEAISGVEGRAIELKAQSLPNPSPLSDTTMGCKLIGPSGLKLRRNEVLWYGSLVAKGRKCSEKGESSRGLDERLYVEGRDDSFK